MPINLSAVFCEESDPGIALAYTLGNPLDALAGCTGMYVRARAFRDLSRVRCSHATARESGKQRQALVSSCAPQKAFLCFSSTHFPHPLPHLACTLLRCKKQIDNVFPFLPSRGRFCFFLFFSDYKGYLPIQRAAAGGQSDVLRELLSSSGSSCRVDLDATILESGKTVSFRPRQEANNPPPWVEHRSMRLVSSFALLSVRQRRKSDGRWFTMEFFEANRGIPSRFSYPSSLAGSGDSCEGGSCRGRTDALRGWSKPMPIGQEGLDPPPLRCLEGTSP